jgi:predicted O-methyltransferase YrrM
MVKVSDAVKQRGKAIIDRTPMNGIVIEVGALRGHLAWWVYQSRPDIQWIMIDNWLPIEFQPKAYRDTRDDHALHSQEQATKNMVAACRVASEIGAQVIEADSVYTASSMLTGSADLVFIDADHSYEGCSADIAAWHRIVKPGGWLGGHDYGNPDDRFGGVDRAVNEAFSRVLTAENYTWWVQK